MIIFPVMQSVELYTRENSLGWMRVFPHDSLYRYRVSGGEWQGEDVSELVRECFHGPSDLREKNEERQSIGDDEELIRGIQEWRDGDDILSEDEDESPFDVSSPGFKMMKNMGWLESMPLGKTGVGLMEPVSSSLAAKLDGDTTGLGYENVAKDLPPIGTTDRAEIVVSKVNDTFGIASSDEGDVFVPNGAIKHLKNMRRTSGDKSGVPAGLHVDAIIVRAEGRFPWRLARVLECNGRLFEIAPKQEWIYGGIK